MQSVNKGVKETPKEMAAELPPLWCKATFSSLLKLLDANIFQW